MTTMNLYRRLMELQPAQPVVTGQIETDLGSGMVRVVMDSGGAIHVLNPLQIAAGKAVYVQDGAITGEAPTLTYVRIEI